MPSPHLTNQKFTIAPRHRSHFPSNRQLRFFLQLPCLKKKTYDVAVPARSGQMNQGRRHRRVVVCEGHRLHIGAFLQQKPHRIRSPVVDSAAQGCKPFKRDATGEGAVGGNRPCNASHTTKLTCGVCISPRQTHTHTYTYGHAAELR